MGCKVSVLMSAYNCAPYIGEAIESILNQSFKDFEFIIINDGSTDGTKEVIESYNDDRIVFINLEINTGLMKALNIGMNKAKGTYLARMDADDICHKDRFKLQVEFLDNNPDYAFVGAYGRRFFEDGTTSIWSAPLNANELKTNYLFFNSTIQPVVTIRRSVLVNENLFYNENEMYVEDYSLWTRLALKYKCTNLPYVLIDIRILGNSLTRTSYNKIEVRRDANIKMYKLIMDKMFNVDYSELDMSLHYAISNVKLLDSLNFSFKALNKHYNYIKKNNNGFIDPFYMKLFMGRAWLTKLKKSKNIKALFSIYTFWGFIFFIKRKIEINRVLKRC